MKSSRHLRTTKTGVACTAVLYLIMAALLFLSTAVAQESSSGNPTSAKDDQIHIEADKLITNQAEKFAEFSGGVRASQGTFVINADRLRIYYQAASASAAQRAEGQETIRQLIATGNVTLSTGKFTAETDRAEYDPKTQVLVLIGERSALKSNRNILTGSKIIVNRKTGQMSVESDSQERVKAIFYTDESSKEKE
ncbi:MAG: lipopolysaccharide transport periplasmic protein LptA [Deltaproteobacteria bacterium]|nr:lipopolysaccharide transport periplasmic protein LptA [Deltaproteobacteria bacterium]